MNEAVSGFANVTCELRPGSKAIPTVEYGSLADLEYKATRR
jgi:hypothetical protein